MEEPKQKSGGWAILVVLIILLGGAILVYAEKALKNDCEDRAVGAAVDRYPINEYPDTTMRGQLQEEYRLNYVRGGCN